jgi:hypothetical protein
MVRFIGPDESCFESSPNHSRRERERFLRFNVEHCEMYWQRAFCETREPVTVMLVDCSDPIGRLVGNRMAGELRCHNIVDECKRRDVLPTLHAAIATPDAIKMLSQLHPSFADAIRRCPDDCFPIWIIAAGGSSLAYRERPAVQLEAH